MAVSCAKTSAAVTTLYEQDELAQLTGGVLRPGGLALTTELLRSCRPTPGSASLDIGCGPGHSVALMASDFGLQACGLDPSAAMLVKAARAMPKAAFIEGIATAIPFAPDSFALVLCECVLSLTGNIEQSLSEMFRILQPNGTLLLTDIYRKNNQAQPDLPNVQSCITSALPLETIETELYNAGFTLLSLVDRSELLKQLAGQIIFSYGSLAKFWQLFMGVEQAHQTCCTLRTTPLGYYVIIAKKDIIES